LPGLKLKYGSKLINISAQALPSHFNTTPPEQTQVHYRYSTCKFPGNTRWRLASKGLIRRRDAQIVTSGHWAIGLLLLLLLQVCRVPASQLSIHATPANQIKSNVNKHEFFLHSETHIFLIIPLHENIPEIQNRGIIRTNAPRVGQLGGSPNSWF
jgi:hypothetical protein